MRVPRSIDDDTPAIGADAGLEEAEVPRRGDLLFPVVGIGGAAGSVAALTALFERMPADSGMAFVVMAQLAPEQASATTAFCREPRPCRCCRSAGRPPSRPTTSTPSRRACNGR